LLWNLLKFVFYVGDIEYMSRTEYKGLPQGSVLSPFLYSLLGSGVDRFITAGCVILQYADDVVDNGDCSCFSKNGMLFFDMVELPISAVKSEAMVFPIKHHKPDVTLWIDGRSLP
jgi:hypothetical protein